MKKFYSIFEIEEWRKKYSDNTDTHLKSWGYNYYGADRISGTIELTTPDDQVPEKGQLFLVTIEPIDRDKLKDSDGTVGHDATKKFFKDLREKDAQQNSGIQTGRKFR